MKNTQTKKTAPPKAAPSKPRVRAPLPTVLHPDHFYRIFEASPFFGYSTSVLHLKIASGEIPAPIALSDAPKSRARGWWGRDIITFQKERSARVAPKLVVGKAGAS